MGRISAGYDASFALWTADPMDEDAQLAWLFIDGVPHEFEVKEQEETDAGGGPDEGVDATGSWKLSINSPVDDEATEATLELRMAETGEVDGELTMRSPIGGGELSATVSGAVSGTRLSAEAELEMEGMVIEVRLKVELDGDSLEGEATWVAPFGEESSEVSGQREPGAVERGSHLIRGADTAQRDGELSGGQS